MSTYGYAVEKVGSAVHILATTEGSLKSRLKSATVEIMIAPSVDLPPKLKEDLEELKLFLIPAKSDMEPKDMTADELRRFTDKLVALCFQMLREQGRGRE